MSARVIRSEAELSRLLAKPGYRVASQFGGAPIGEVVNTDSMPSVAGDGVAAGSRGSDVRSAGRGWIALGTKTDDEWPFIANEFRTRSQMTLLELRELRFRLPQPVSVNELYRTNLHTGAKYLTDAQRQFRSQVIGIVRGEMLRAELRNQPLLGKLEARVVVSDRLDIDNGLKSLLDALQHAKAYRNDGQIRRLIVDVVAMPQGREWCDVALREIAA